MFKKIIINKTNNFFIQLFRYSFVGGIAAVVNFSVFFILRSDYFRFSIIFSNIIANSLGLTINYILSTFWVFKHRKVKQKFFEFLIFVIIGIIGIFFETVLLKIFIEYFQIINPIAKIISIGIVFFWNFLVRRITLFYKKEDQIE